MNFSQETFVIPYLFFNVGKCSLREPQSQLHFGVSFWVHKCLHNLKNLTQILICVSESERGERERKGDLDQYERVDGDRNVTSRLLAVKKVIVILLNTIVFPTKQLTAFSSIINSINHDSWQYTRTAEREAILIRPMPILQKTIDYLLTLLDQPYDERFLGVYNFLWDRMRAIRMDLRMQHIFNQGAITMLEQMVLPWGYISSPFFFPYMFKNIGSSHPFY